MGKTSSTLASLWDGINVQGSENEGSAQKAPSAELHIGL
jgi:hypothetical protein